MSLQKTIEQMVMEHGWPTSKIHSELQKRGINCSRRSVRRYANPVRKQINGSDDAYMPKILLMDIETAPMEVYTWSLWPKFIGTNQVIKDVSVIAWTAKWLFSPDLIYEVASPIEAYNRDDKRILGGIWQLLDKADIIVAHNGAKFDTRVLNARFALNGMVPPMPYRIIDTYRTIKRSFQLSSYKLDYVNKLFNLTPKKESNMDLWKRCVSNEPESQVALEEMLEYNQVDVIALEECYLTVRPWIKGHPAYALFIDTDKEICTNCGSSNLGWEGKYYTPAGRYKAFRCYGCGAIGRSRYSDLSKEERKLLHISVAK